MQQDKAYIQAWWKSPRGRFHRHISNAKKRGVGFRLTFEEWWGVWEASGKWSLRGRGRGQYVMARFGDQGVYEIGNVRICLASENLGERNRSHPISAEQASALGKVTWAKVPPEQRAAIMEARRSQRIYTPYSAETRTKLSAAAKINFRKRLRNERGQFV